MTTKPSPIAILLTPRIGQLNASYAAGTERIFLDDVAHLRSEGYTVIACARSGIANQHITPLYYPAVSFVSDLLYGLIFSVKTKHCQKLLGYSMPLLALLRPAKTLVIMETEYDIPFAHIFARRYRQSRFYFCSHSMKQYYEKKYPWLRRAFGVLHNATDTNLFQPSIHKQTTNKRIIRLLYTSAWVPEKGLLVLLKALLLLPPSIRRRVRLTIASNQHLWYTDTPEMYTSYIQHIQRLIQKIGSVNLLGGVAYTQMPRVYREHDALVFPSLWNEPFGLTVLESLACGTPVIAFASGGVNEIVDTTNSIFVKKNTPQALAEGIQTFRTSPLWEKTKKISLLTPKNEDMIMNVRLQKLHSLLV